MSTTQASSEQAAGARRRSGRAEDRGGRHPGVRRRSRQALLRGPGVAAGRRFRQRGDWRGVQLTPPGSPCSDHLRQGSHDRRAGLGSGHCSSSSMTSRRRAPSSSTRRRRERRVPLRGTASMSPARRARAGAGPEGHSYRSLASFSDPDGNGWLLQEVTTRLPGRGLSSLDVATLTELLRETEERHGEYEPTAPKHHWSDWYAAYIVARERGKLRRGRQRRHAPHRSARRGDVETACGPTSFPVRSFPTTSFSDHRGKHRTLSALQEAIRWCWCSPAAASVRRTGDSTRGSCSSIARCRWATAAS